MHGAPRRQIDHGQVAVGAAHEALDSRATRKLFQLGQCLGMTLLYARQIIGVCITPKKTSLLRRSKP